MKTETIFKIVAVILVGIAALFFWQKNWDAVFASLVLAACAFFLNMRFEIKARMNARAAEAEAEAERMAAEDEVEEAEEQEKEKVVD